MLSGFQYLQKREFQELPSMLLWDAAYSKCRISNTSFHNILGLIFFMDLFHKILCRMINSVDPDQTSLIRVCIVCIFYIVRKVDVQNLRTISILDISGLTMQATILAYMFSLLERNKVTVPLGGSSSTTAQNVEYIHKFLLDLLKAAFPHLNE